MGKSILSLMKKDFRMMLSSKFFLLALGSLMIYSCYINFVYVKLDQKIYPIYLYDPENTQPEISDLVIKVNSLHELSLLCADGYGIGIHRSGEETDLYVVSSGVTSIDHYRFAYASSVLTTVQDSIPQIVGENNKEMKNLREITCEFLFFELTAVGFLGLASSLFQEKKMGVIRVYSILPVSKSAFILSKLFLFLMADLVFAAALTLLNLGWTEGFAVLPAVLMQAGLLSVIMVFVGFLLAVRLSDFKQFSLFYLVLAVFITTPVFLVGQTQVAWNWINYHPMYYLFMAMKKAYFGTVPANSLYYLVCFSTIILLFLLVRKALIQEMAREGGK